MNILNILIVAILLEIIINRIMRYVSHPLSNKTRPNFLPTDLGVIIRVNHKVFWARNTRNPTIADCCEVRVYENVWMQLYIVNFFISDTI